MPPAELDAFTPEHAPTHALLTAPGRDAGAELIAQVRDRPDPGTVRIRDFQSLEMRTLPAEDLADEFPTASEIMRPDDLDFPCHCAGDIGDGYLVSRYTVSDSSDVSVERFVFQRDANCLDLLDVTDKHPPHDVIEFLDECSLHVTS